MIIDPAPYEAFFLIPNIAPPLWTPHPNPASQGESFFSL